MKKKTKLVLNVLKLKSKALGFSKDELEGIAADVANNFDLDEEASDEDVNAEIEKQVDAVIPFLKIAQKTAQRTIQNFKDSIDDNDEDDVSNGTGIKNNHKKDEEAQKEIPVWAQAIIEQNKALQTEILSMKSDNVANGRRAKLKALLKDKGTFGKTVLKNFDRMKFSDETEFDDFYDGVIEDLAAIDQERANEGLSKLGAPAGPEHKEETKPDVLKDDEIDELANTL